MLPCAKMIARPDVASCQTSASVNAIRSCGIPPANRSWRRRCDAIVDAVARDAVHARIGARRDRRVPNGGVRRQKVDLRLGEPGAALAQGGERWHRRGVPIEVIPPHAIQNEQHDHSRSSKTGPQDRQYTACRRRGHLHAKRRRKRWRNVLLHGRHRVHSRSHCRARKHQRNRDVIRPRRTVHVRHVRVRPRDEVAFTWHDQELAGSSGKVCPSEHLEEALSRRKGGGIGRRRTPDSRRVAPRRSLDLLARNRPSHRDQGQGDSDPQSYFAHASTFG